MFDESRGLLGKSVQLPDTDCTLLQLFSTVEITISASQIADRWKIASNAIDVIITEQSIILQTHDGKDLLTGVFWHSVQPQSSKWTARIDGSLRLVVAKQPSRLGSWPYVFQSLAFAATPKQLECIWEKNKDAWEEEQTSFVRERRLELLGLQAAFAQEVYDQIGPGRATNEHCPTFCFPSDANICLEHLSMAENQSNAVNKLLYISRKVFEVDILSGEGDVPLIQMASCLIAGLASVEALRATAGLEAIKAAHACIGYGPGEYCALVFAGAMQYEDALRLLLIQVAGLRESQSVAISAVHKAVEGMSLRQPRIPTFSGSGQQYESIRSIRERLPTAVCKRPPTPMQYEKLKAALIQQGYGNFVELIDSGCSDMGLD